jgi:microcompartment protein CcmL/EutN
MNIVSIGLIELNSIAGGIEVADFMIKAANVELIFAKPVCPGKFIVLIYGEVAAVNASVETGVNIGKNFVVDSLVIANVQEQLIPAINAANEIPDIAALGVMEFFNIASAIIAADQAAKTADVRLIEVRLGMGIGGKSFVTLSGEVSAVKAAIDAGLVEAADKGNVVSSCVIPSPSKELFLQLI